MNVILLHSEHRHVSATRVAIFRAVRTRTKVHITPQFKKKVRFWSTFLLNGKRVIIIKNYKLKTVACCSVE